MKSHPQQLHLPAPVHESKGVTPRRRIRERLLIFGSLLCSSIALHADNIYWIPSSGDWDSSAVNWSDTPGATSANRAWGTGTADTAIFSDTSTVAIKAALSAKGLIFANGSSTLAGDGTLRQLTLTGASPEIAVNAAATAILGSNLQILATQKAFTKTGAGVLEIRHAATSNEYYFGTLAQSNGSQILVNEGTLRVSASGLNNTYTHITVASGATLELNNGLNIGGLSGGGSVVSSPSTTTARQLLLRGVNGNFSGVISGSGPGARPECTLSLTSASRSAKCIQNIRQLGSFILQYSTDHNGNLLPVLDKNASEDGKSGITWFQIL